MAFDPPLDVNPMPIREPDCNCEQAERLKARVVELEELVEAATKELAKRDELLGDIRGRINRVLMPAATKCPTCDGTGQVSDEWKMEECGDCEGTGKPAAVLAPLAPSPEVKP